MTHRTSRGLTRAELAILVVLAGLIAGCGLLRARMAGNEAAAIASLRVIASAQVAYQKTCGEGGYAATLVILGTPVGEAAEPFLRARLGSAAAPETQGYRFEMGAGIDAEVGPTDCHAAANPTITTFYASAEPLRFRESGRRSFAVNPVNVIWQNLTAEAPTEPFGPPATPVR